jgi:hypothetical protein
MLDWEEDLMPPRAGGQLDEISQAIGRLSGQVEGIEKYIHDKRHDDANVSQKVDGLGTQITREVARMKAELQVQLDAMDRSWPAGKRAADPATSARSKAFSATTRRGRTPATRRRSEPSSTAGPILPGPLSHLHLGARRHVHRDRRGPLQSRGSRLMARRHERQHQLHRHRGRERRRRHGSVA